MGDYSAVVQMSNDYNLLVGSATYPTRNVVENSKPGSLLRGVMEPGRYDGDALDDTGESVTIPAGTRLLMYHGNNDCVNVLTEQDITVSTNEAGGLDTLVARITRHPETQDLQFNVLAIAAADVDANDIELGVTAAGTFTEDVGLDATGRFL